MDLTGTDEEICEVITKVLRYGGQNGNYESRRIPANGLSELNLTTQQEKAITDLLNSIADINISFAYQSICFLQVFGQISNVYEYRVTQLQ